MNAQEYRDQILIGIARLLASMNSNTEEHYQAGELEQLVYKFESVTSKGKKPKRSKPSKHDAPVRHPRLKRK